VPQGKKVLLYLGRIHPKKGLRNLLQAWASLGRRNASGLAQWHLVIAGWDQAGHERELKALCASLGIEDQVTFAGAQFDAHKDATFRKASAFILPSFGEGMPMVVLEAWSYRLPVLMTPQCNLVDAIDMGAALRIEPQVESIASGIDALFSLSSRDAAVMADKGRALVETRFVWEKIGVEMGRVYDWVLGGGDTPESVSR
jgi:poly(glycerol-phosphate) alpha-glucosyltransferase